jgi:hypothetical protein
MKIAIATTAIAVGVATLVGCGQASDRATDSIALADGSRSFNNFGPEWQADTNLSRLMPKEDDVVIDADADDDYVPPQPIALPRCPAGPAVHFDSPEAAMTYLAAAWNRDDLAALCQVTNPNARFLLNDMHREAVNLRLKSCEPTPSGAYICTFLHDYPRHMHKKGTGRAWMTANPADNPGWYMGGYVGCG